MVGRTFSSSKGAVHKARSKLAVRKGQIAVFCGFWEKLKFFNSASALRETIAQHYHIMELGRQIIFLQSQKYNRLNSLRSPATDWMIWQPEADSIG